jgi:hypothetical protein
VQHDGPTAEGIDRYRALAEERRQVTPRIGTGEVEISEVELLGLDGSACNRFRTGEHARVRIRYVARQAAPNPVFSVSVHSADGVLCTTFGSDGAEGRPRVLEGKGVLDLNVQLDLLPNIYLIDAAVLKAGGLVPYDRREHLVRFQVDGDRRGRGVCYLPHSWAWRDEP